MHAQTLHLWTMLTTVSMQISVASAHCFYEPDLVQLLQMVNDHTIPCEERAAAERELIESSHDISMLPVVFSNLADPVFSALAGREIPIEHAYPGSPSTGSAETDCIYLPVKAQIAYARFRIWQAFAKNGEPENDRKLAFVALFEDYETKLQFRQLLDMSMHNHSETLEEKLWSLFADRENDTNIRGLSAATLRSVTGVHSRVRSIQYSRTIVEYVWEERGSEVATSVGAWGGGHPLGNVLMLDWYDRERNPETQRSRMSTKDILDRVDRSFGNISGLYRDPLARRDEFQERYAALQREARETGDDTKLRAFEEEHAEQQRKELEERIERIDAWIAENRERLEREAEEYAEQRRRERERESQESR